jgi:hypothetical protein
LLLGTPIGFAVLLALAALPPVAGGDSVAIRVEFDAPAGCSSADTFYGGLLARMNRARRAVSGEDAIRLAVRLTRVGNRVRGELRLMGGGRGEGDTRRVEGETCDAVVEVLSLTAALALVERPPPPTPPPSHSTSPSRSSSSSQSSSSSSQSSSSSDKGTKPPASEIAKPPEAEQKPPEQKQEKEPEPAAVTVEPARKPPEPSRGRRFELGLRGVAAYVISGVNVGGGLALRLEKNTADGAGASVGVSFLYASNDLLQKADNVAVNWMALAATVCPGWSVGRTVTVQPCAQAIGGWLTATGRGISNPDSVGRTWWSVGALLRGAARLGAGFSLEIEAGASVPLARRSFFISTPEGTVGQSPTVAPIVALGLSRSL